MAWFCAMVTSVRVILSAKVVWAAAKDADVAEKVQTTSIIERNSRVDMEICCDGGVDVLGPSNAVGARGTEGAILGSSVSFTGWSTTMSSATS